jgi:anti-sigma factor RsiW
MKNEPCNRIRPDLAAYGDGELSADWAAQVAAHLANCAACRADLQLLQDSLALAQEVWQDASSAFPMGKTQPVTPRPLGEGPGVRAIRSAASRQKTILVAGLTLGATVLFLAIGWHLFPAGKSPSTARKPPSSPRPGEIAVSDHAANADVMEYIAREGRAARLAASMQMLATEPGLKEYKDNAERYLRENYGDTAAVKMLDQ